MSAKVRTNWPRTWVFTHHAAERALDMALTPDELRRAMYEPDSRREVTSRDDCDWYYVHGQITLAVKADRDKLVVVTVLWSTEAAWRADELLPLPEGREVRENPFRAPLAAV